MRGDYAEIAIRREIVSDGSGAETAGVVVRVWGESDTYAEDGETFLLAELTVPGLDPPPAFPPLQDLIEHVLSAMEVTD